MVDFYGINVGTPQFPVVCVLAVSLGAPDRYAFTSYERLRSAISRCSATLQSLPGQVVKVRQLGYLGLKGGG